VRVPPLEGLSDGDDRETFSWTLLIPLPDELDDETVSEALDAGTGVRIELLDEGTCAEVIHVGPYAEEAPTITRLHAFITTPAAPRVASSRDLPERSEKDPSRPLADDRPAARRVGKESPCPCECFSAKN